MKKNWVLLITGLFLSACVFSQTEASPTLTLLPSIQTDTSIPPTGNSVSPTSIPNTDGVNAFITFCESIIEGNIDKALPLFTEDIKIFSIHLPYEGLKGVEDLINDWSNQSEYICEVKNFKVNGDEVEFRWYESHKKHGVPEGLFEANCKCSATLKEEKIDRLVFECNGGIIPIE